MPGDPEDGAVTVWLGKLKAGDPDAARPLWNEYFSRLAALARARLRAAPATTPADGEDVALSAFDSFCRAARNGRFPRLDDRDDLWRVLLTLTERKAAAAARRERRVKRGGGTVAHESALPAGESGGGFPARVAGPDPTPEFAAEVSEEVARLLGLLPAELRDVAVWKMEGYTNAEIAARLGRAVPTVERKLARIRKTWERRGGGPDPADRPGTDE